MPVGNVTKSKSFIGRPSSYREEYCDRLVKFYKQPSTKKQIRTVTLKNGSVINEPFDAPNKPVHVVDFCDDLDIAISTFYKWVEDYPAFSEAYKHAKSYLERNVVDNALLNNYNGGFASLVSKNWFGWKDKSETDLTSKGEKIGMPADLAAAQSYADYLKQQTSS